MEVLMEKELNRTDIELCLAFPTSSRRAFSMPEGETAVYFEATDTLEKKWNFRLSRRSVITGDWLQFVRDKGLKVGDKIFMWREEGATGVRYTVRAETKIFGVWVNVQ
ncbi:hypothetical protein OIU84_023156 [Salix udensis]|uniref:TF-B3 domain-containing protein n=1 Tax=Salix udensis TaxID=889485 RepID=A0AAD6KSN3_9ROSI|nr:hypothetical protein OIU84_023156 [Salix udensis]